RIAMEPLRDYRQAIYVGAAYAFAVLGGIAIRTSPYHTKYKGAVAPGFSSDIWLITHTKIIYAN
ncbi:hypothetical protein, partial [Mycoplasmopsis bovis]|uniref:hypothetical protein n=1 Tax=Mycoplasmopsis bovis TaxID=28903 RepID=UPI003D2CFB17